MLILIASVAAAAPARALADSAGLDAAQKLTREVCEAIGRKDFKPLQELIRNGDIQNELIQRMPETYPTDPKRRQAIAAGFMKMVEAQVPKIWAAATTAERCMLPPRDEKGSLVVTVRFDSRSEQKAQFTIFQTFRYRASPEGLRLVNIETPLAGIDIVSATAATMPAHWPQTPADRERLARQQAVIVAMMRGSHFDEERAARQALKESPDDTFFRLKLADALASMKKHDDEKELYRDMLARGQAVLFAHYQLATVAVTEGRYDEAVAQFQTVLDRLGEDDWLLTQIANAQMLAGKTAEAKGTLERALKASPFSRYALLQRARLRVHEGDLDGAAADLRLVKEHHGLNAVSVLEDPDLSKVVLADKYRDILGRPPPTTP
jgi:tetratricopeptide (TPR) repeat protein